MASFCGEHYHFRCGAHAVTEGATRESPWADYRCGIKGCERPAKAYWYRGPQFEKLPEKVNAWMMAFG